MRRGVHVHVVHVYTCPPPSGVVLRIRIVTPKDALRSELLFVISRGLHDISICALARGARQSLGPVWAWGRKAVPGMWANLEDVWCSREEVQLYHQDKTKSL